MSLIKRDVTVNGDIIKEYYTDEEGNITVSTSQDVAGIVQRNKDIASVNNGYSDDKSFQHVASIPMTVIAEWRKQGIDIYKKEDWPKIMAMLNDGDYALLRSGKGQL